eukprot:TRINITY_DN3827_c0_g1_i1.p1 TRINITY_DN3827_c0_g1~~TRINITY_DN3827_c0_g1_i1.p1  ORF type:complete len:349 (-),score=54.44 TRINITY_DN3827_c0_g1_i1:151-1197(-)
MDPVPDAFPKIPLSKSGPPVPISLVSFNTYLIPSWFVNEHTYSCKDQDVRAQRIGQWARDYELLVFQEVWGSNVHLLEQGLGPDHSVLPFCRSWGNMPVLNYLATAVDTALFFFWKVGGLWFAHRRETFSVLRSQKINYSVGPLKQHPGILVTLVDMNYYWPGRKLLIFNTHLDSPSPKLVTEPRAIQLREALSLLQGIVFRDQFNLGADFDWSSCACVLVGDLNINADSEQHQHVLQTFGGARDLYKELHPDCSQTTYDDKNSLTIHKDDCGRIDHIIAIDQVPAPPTSSPSSPSPPPSPSSSSTPSSTGEMKQFLKLKCLKIEVETQPAGEELSDHWPVVSYLIPY